MERHLRWIGILNAGLGALGLIASAVILLLAGGPAGVLLINARAGGSTATVEGMVTAGILVYLVLTAGPLIAAGIGLLRYQEWGRNLAIILSIIMLLHIPIGTMVAIYTLWVLTSHEVEPLFQTPPQPRNL